MPRQEAEQIESAILLTFLILHNKITECTILSKGWPSLLSHTSNELEAVETTLHDIGTVHDKGNAVIRKVEDFRNWNKTLTLKVWYAVLEKKGLWWL